MLGRGPSTPRLNSEQGFTLIEMMVAMVSGVVLATASWGLLQLATEQASRASDFVQASQIGRTAMTHLVDEVSSGCVTENAAPVQEGSTSEKLIFVAAYSKRSEVQPNEVQEHKIYWKTGAKPGLYDEKRIASKRLNETEWEFSEKYSEPGVLIDTNVAREKNKSGEYEIFKYFDYGKNVTSSSEGGLSALEPITLKEHQELSKGEASHIASMEIKFRSLPADNSEKRGRDVSLNSEVTFAFSAGFTEPTDTSTGACQNQ